MSHSRIQNKHISILRSIDFSYPSGKPEEIVTQIFLFGYSIQYLPLCFILREWLFLLVHLEIKLVIGKII